MQTWIVYSRLDTSILLAYIHWVFVQDRLVGTQHVAPLDPLWLIETSDILPWPFLVTPGPL